MLGSVLRQLDKKHMRQQAAEQMHNLGIQVQSIRQAVETLSGGQRQAVAVARAAGWGRKVVILDEPTASLGVRETHQVLDLIRRVREHGISVVLISHSMPEVYAIADRIHIHRLGRRAAIVSPKTTVMSDVVAVMTGALPSDAVVSASLAPDGTIAEFVGTRSEPLTLVCVAATVEAGRPQGFQHGGSREDHREPRSRIHIALRAKRFEPLLRALRRPPCFSVLKFIQDCGRHMFPRLKALRPVDATSA